MPSSLEPNSQPSPAPGPRHMILVVGPHRSGTSALTRTINLLGASVPSRVLQPVAGNNERGFWEPAAIVELHDRMLESAGSAWDDVAALPSDWFASGVAAQFADELAEVVRAEYGDAPLSVVKDPRLCALLPIWQRILPGLGLTPEYVLPLRHPLEVARSLEARDQFPLAKGLLLWLRNSLDAERHTRGARRVFVRYEELLADWPATLDRVAATLDLVWPRKSALAASEIDAFLTPDLRHQRSGPTQTTLRYPWVQRAFSALHGLAGGDPGAIPKLDGVRAEVDGTAAIYAEALTATGLQLSQAGRRLAAEAAEAAENTRQAERREGHLLVQIAAAEARADAAEARADAAEARAVAAEARADAAEARADAAEAASASQSRTLSWRLTRPLRQLDGSLRPLHTGTPTAPARSRALKGLLDSGERLLHRSPVSAQTRMAVIRIARQWFPGYAKNPPVGAPRFPMADPDGLGGVALDPAVARQIYWNGDWKALARGYCQTADAVLIADWRIPTPDLDSGSFRMTALIDAIVASGTRLHFAGAAQAPEVSSEVTPEMAARYRERLEAKGVVVIEGLDAVLGHLTAHGGTYHTAILSRPGVAAEFLPLVRSFCPNARIVYDTVDLHWVRFARGAAVAAGDTERREQVQKSQHFKRLEIALARSCDLTLAITEEERLLLEREEPGLSVAVLPNIHEIAPTVPGFAERSGLLFIGGFSHHPNVEAVLYFVETIFPAVRTAIPDAEFVILGSAMPHDVRRLGGPGIRAVGYVEDVAPFFERARVFVAPLLHGAGMKGKVGQSLSFGLPLVTTSIGAEGIGLVDGENAMVCDDPQGFAERVIRVYQDEDLWRRLSAAGRQLIEENFSAGSLHDQIRRLINERA